MLDVTHQLASQIGHRGEDAAGDHGALDLREPEFHLVEPGRIGRRVATKGDIVWEYMFPLFGGANASNAVYRAYRVPYGWIPQLTIPSEQRVTPPALSEFRVQ